MKKKIIIFSSTGGGGHISATKALTTYLENNYHVKVAYPFIEILSSIDIIRKLTANRYHVENFYNTALQKRLFLLLNAFYYIGTYYYMKLQSKKTLKLIEAFIQTENPDLVISVTPLLNDRILKVTQKINIPFLLIPTDLDTTTFIQGIYNPTHKNFRMLLAFNEPNIIKTVKPAHIKEEYLSIAGFPLQRTFFKQYNTDLLKKELHIPKETPVILLMMGATGSRASVVLLEEMKKIKHKCHIIICLGKAENIKNEIEELLLPSHISITVFGFTENIAQLMSISDIFVTKSGTVSICEALYMDLPILIDATNTALAWEKFNHQFVIEKGFGDILYNKNDISKKINLLFENPKKLNKYRNNIKRFEKKKIDNHIQELVHSMLD